VSDPQRGDRDPYAWYRNGLLDASTSMTRLPSTDMEAGLEIRAVHPDRLHYAPVSSTWYVWDGHCHQPDVSGEIGHLVNRTIIQWERLADQCRTAIYSQIDLEFPPHVAGGEREREQARKQRWAEPYDARIKYVRSLKKTAGRSAMINYLAGLCGCDETIFNEQHPEWLNCANGTVDLASGALKSHDPADMIAYCLDTAWNPAAVAPRFWRLLARAVGDDPWVAAYLLKVLGYSLLGTNPEQQIFFISGPTSSGKSVLLEVVTDVLGPLAHNSQAALVTVQRHGRNARVENSIRGRRLITITETSAFMTIDEGQVKRLTGESTISVDKHYHSVEIKTPVTWTVIGATNQMPTLTDFDDAMRRRVVIIPGGPTIPAAERLKALAGSILEEEREGILALLVKACAQYHREGSLIQPLQVQAATDAYAAEQNTVANFIADMCVMMGGAVGGVIASVPAVALWEAYTGWARGTSRLGRNEFYAHMETQPGVTRNEAMRRFEGLYLRDASGAETRDR
jgi:putative DNA primase/helicase